MWQDIGDGDVMAWARHKTGWNEDDEFKSVATIYGGSAKANGDIRRDDEVWVVVERLVAEDVNTYYPPVDVPEVLGDYPTLRTTTDQADPGLTQTTPISDLTDLENMALDLAGNYYLTGNIDASATAGGGYNGGNGWEPIDNFTGTFDGGGYTISDLTTSDDDQNGSGLFGAVGVSGCIIANVTLANVSIRGEISIGSLVGTAGTSAQIYNCHASGTITATDNNISNIGGLIGDAKLGADIYDCSSSVTVDAYSSHTDTSPVNVGGLVGSVADTATSFNNCSATGNIRSNGVAATNGNYVGGFFGFQSSGSPTFTDCSATGDVRGDDYVGGFGGVTGTTVITRCSATGDVIANDIAGQAGGFTGSLGAGSTTDCYAQGNVTGGATTGFAGGFTGKTVGGSFFQSYSIGTTTANTVGGFSASSGAMSDCYWDTESSGQLTSSGSAVVDTEFEGRGTTSMKTEGDYADTWDFDTIWFQEYTAGYTIPGYWAIEDITEKFIEQFQAEDWGDDADYCWFVDSGIGEWNDYTPEVPEVPEVPAIPPAQIRDEAYVIANNRNVVWLDSSFNVLDYEDLGAGVVCMDVGSDSTGIVVAAYIDDTTNLRITRWDLDLNPAKDFFVPDGGWEGNTDYISLQFTDDDQYLYAVAWIYPGFDTLYKFDATTGAEIWKVADWKFNAFAIAVDSSDNVYVSYFFSGLYKIHVYDSEGNLTNENMQPGYFAYDIEVDETNNRVYACGNTNQIGPANTYHQIAAINTNGGSINYFQTDSTGGICWNIVKVGDYIYAAIDRKQCGIGGAWASVLKLDSSLNLIASYDTGMAGTEVWVDHDDNIAVKSGYYGAGQLNAGIWLLDTDLNYIADYRLETESAFGPEAANIPFMDSGTPAIPAVPAVPGYWTPGLSHIGTGNDVCVYADGIPIGVYTVDSEGGIDGLDETAYDVLIAGINYYSTYESFPLRYTEESNIHNVMIDFYESLGCNAGVSRTNSEDWRFSKDNFATKLDLVTEFKNAPFFWGTNRDPVVHLWTWIPVPNTMRQIITELEVER